MGRACGARVAQGGSDGSGVGPERHVHRLVLDGPASRLPRNPVVAERWSLHVMGVHPRVLFVNLVDNMAVDAPQLSGVC